MVIVISCDNCTVCAIPVIGLVHIPVCVVGGGGSTIAPNKGAFLSDVVQINPEAVVRLASFGDDLDDVSAVIYKACN